MFSGVPRLKTEAVLPDANRRSTQRLASNRPTNQSEQPDYDDDDPTARRRQGRRFPREGTPHRHGA